MIKKLPAFDPAPSVKLALDILKSAEVKNFALIGRIATWFYLDSDLHQFTKDVDFAVPLSVVKAIEQEIIFRKLNYCHLSIGGLGIREKEDIKIDFIDRRLRQTDRLFAEAIKEACSKAIVGSLEVPVVSLEHLVAMKMVSGEPKDDKDVRDLLMVKTIDYKKAKSIVEKYLGGYVADRLDISARDAGILPPRGPYIY
ncbi:MAG: hypothetical protein GY795_44830 [Desulfobacterales bacterium]|nr:hypothetical protein [Desulfobacterales bacterium]